VSLSLNEVTVTLDEVKVVNSTCVLLYWRVIGRHAAAVQWLRVRYWSMDEGRDWHHTSVLVPVSPSELALDGLERDTSYGFCLQPVYQSGVVGECSNTRHAYVTSQHNGIITALYLVILPPDAVHWRGICCGGVAVCLCVGHVDVLYPND